MATIRYPYNKRPRPEFCEVPLDVTDRSAGTILVKLADIPREKYAFLEQTLNRAKQAFFLVTAQWQAAKRAAGGRIEGSAESEIFRAIAVVQRTEKMKPAVKRLLRSTLEDLARKVGESAASEEQLFLAELRSLCISNGLLGQRVLSFAEALTDAQSANAAQLAEEAFSLPMAEAVRSMRVARGDLIRHGITDHKDLFGEITLDDGQPLLDEETGAPKVEPIPFVAASWSWGGKKKAGCSQETLSLYEDISDTGGCLYSLSEAILLWGKGIVPTPEKIWSDWEESRNVVVEATEEATGEEDGEASAPVNRDGDAPQGEVVPFGQGE